MQGKGRVKNINEPCRKKSPVEGAGDPGSEVGAVVIGGKALFHANSIVGQGRKELKEGVEVVARKVREES